MKVRIASNLLSQPDGSYARQALMRGLEFQEAQGFNPFKFGVIGSSDTHNGSYAGDDDNFWSKTGILDDEPKERGSVPLDGEPPRYLDTYRSTWSAGSLAAAWAEENTRESIYAAFRRKETFSTSGSRIAVRFFAGYDLPEPGAADWVGDAYAKGVPMGGDLLTRGTEAPSFLAWARQDAQCLARLQVIKAAYETERLGEGLHCLPGRRRRSRRHRCPESTASVDLTSCASQGTAQQCFRRAGATPITGGKRPCITSGPREPKLPLVDLGCAPHRSNAQSGPAPHHSGAGLELPHLVERCRALRSMGACPLLVTR